MQEVTNNTSCETKLRSIEASKENRASIWLTVLPIKRNGNKRSMPSEMQCESDIISLWNVYQHYGGSFNLQHALSCPKGGLVITRHNELRNPTAKILGEICKNVVIEQLLTPLTGDECPKFSNMSNQARADVSARGLWINGQTAFCNVRVFNPLARCHLHHSLRAFHKNKKNPKRNGSIISESFKWNMDRSDHLCFHVLEE